MRLKSIKLAGFKSFVDPTSVHFPSNLCSIVGPNGCGKSNIIDAVRWVMGESSAKQLRGESLTDVIFNGSGGRKPVGQASIELLFDNSAGRITGEYAGFAEISVKRIVTREATSEYFLNGTRCRRRDITDVFLGTGLGPRSYSIIEQGMISQLITARPEELRAYVEEAAGISRYKERRRDTENRIRRTRENLERLNDIREELGRQLQRLQRQAQAAEKYREFKETERTLRLQWQALKWREFDRRAERERQKITDGELELERQVARDASCESAIENLRAQQAERQEQLNEIQGRYFSVGSEIARCEQSIKHAEQSRQKLLSDLEETERSYVETREHLEHDRSRVSGLRAELDQIEPQLEQSRQRSGNAAAALADADREFSEWQQQWDDFQKQAADARQQAEVQQSRIQHIERVLQDHAGREARLAAAHRAAIETGALEAERKSLQQKTAEGGAALAALREQEDRSRQQIEALREEVTGCDAALHEVRERLQNHRGRMASLEALQEAALGIDQPQLGQWLESAGIDSSERLLDRIEVESGWERAVETVLGNSLQALSVASLDRLARSLDDLANGAVEFVETVASSASSLPGTLAEKVSGPGIAGRVQNVLLAESLADALARRNQLAPHQSLVTRDGIWLGRDWLRVQRGELSEAGVLQRKQEIAELLDAIESDATAEAELVQRRERTVSHLQEAEHTSQSRRGAIERGATELAALESRQATIASRLEQQQQQAEQLAGELDGLKSQVSEEQSALAQARATLSAAIEQMDADNRQREQLLARREGCRSALEQARSAAQQARDQGHQLELQRQQLATQLAALEQGAERLQQQLGRLGERRDSLQSNSQIEGDPLPGLREELQQKLTQRVAVEAELQAARAAVEECDAGLRDKESERHAVQADLQACRERLQELRIAAQEVITLRKNLQEQLGGQDPATLLAELPDEASVQRWDEQLQQIGARIERLGAINLAAIDEYKVESERKSYLDAQNEELTRALDTLEGAIRRIDRETRTRFKETFDRINEGVQALFPKLFGGGQAWLELTGEDLLETGVTLMARPPGKRNSTIHLLSGGEKALTAIALVFAIFQLNPAPFCMLDEVDAPLDDANVGRFARMVEEMSEKVQFIVITHNKITMEMAHQLMGVTMHEPGVSRLVTVDVDAAVELAEM